MKLPTGTRSILFALATGLFALFAIANARAVDLIDGCTTPYEHELYRDVHGLGGVRVWLSRHGPVVDICVKLGNCFWRIANVSIDQLGQLGPYADPRSACVGPAPHWSGYVWRSECELDNIVSQSLVLPTEWLNSILGSAEGACGTVTRPIENKAFVVQASSTSTLMLQVQVEQFCMAIPIRLSDMASSALFRFGCLANGEEAIRFLAGVRPLLSPDPNWFGIDSPVGGFAVAVHPERGPASGVSFSNPKVWGRLEQSYVSNWLTAVTAAAAGAAPISASADPLPSASRAAVYGRLAKWVVAGLMRVSTKPFDQTEIGWRTTRNARDWMARNVLLDGTAGGNTLLRGELARRDWGP